MLRSAVQVRYGREGYGRDEVCCNLLSYGRYFCVFWHISSVDWYFLVYFLDVPIENTLREGEEDVVAGITG